MNEGGDDGIRLENSSDNILSDNTCRWNTAAGIYLENSSDNTLSGNTANSNHRGVHLWGSSDNTLSGNTADSNRIGIHPYFSNSNKLSDNTCRWNTATGIYLFQSSNNTVSDNACSNTEYGIYLWGSSDNALSGNTANSNDRGIYLYSSSNSNTLSGNTADSNDCGIYLQFGSNNNTIFLNNFSDNTTNVSSLFSADTWHSPTTLCYFYASSHKNYLGNYYSDYGGSDANGDGIGDTDLPYITDGPGDNYPLVDTSDNYEVQAWWLSNPTMYRADMGKPPGSVEIAAGGSNVWISDEAAATDVAFPNNTWTGQVVLTSAPALNSILVEIGCSPDGSDFIPGGPEQTIGDGSSMALTFETSAASFTVPNRQYLALRITNNDSSAHTVTTGGAWSYASSPDTGAPRWPGLPMPVGGEIYPLDMAETGSGAGVPVLWVGLGLVLVFGVVWGFLRLRRVKVPPL